MEVSKEGCRLVEGPRTRYASLRDLVMATSALTTLYPDHSKEEVAFDKETWPSARSARRQGGGGGAGQAGATSDTGVEGAEAPVPTPRSTPPPYKDFEMRIPPAEGAGPQGEASGGESGGAGAGAGADDADTASAVSSPSPPTYAETQSAVRALE